MFALVSAVILITSAPFRATGVKHISRRISKVERVFKFPFERFHKIRFPVSPGLGEIKDPKARRKRKTYLGYFRNRPVYRFLTRMPNMLYAMYGVQQSVTVDLLVHWVSTYEQLVCFKGEVYAIDLLKKIHGICLRYSANSSFEEIPFLSKDRYGVPLLVEPFTDLLRGSLNERRCSLCLLSLYKMVLVRGEDPTVDSIVAPFSPDLDISFLYRGEFLEKSASKLANSLVDPRGLGECFRAVLEEMFPRKYRKSRLKSLVRLSKLHVSSRNGPNAQSISGAAIDLVALKSSPTLYKAILEIATLTDHKDLLAFLAQDTTDWVVEATNKVYVPIHSRLSIKAEPGAKTRYFAIVDYFTQSALKSFHLWAFKYLSGLREDGTLSQDRACQMIKEWTEQSEARGLDVYSTDLSKATDRLPAYLQREIVWHLFGKDYAEHWYTIVTDRDFTVPNSNSTVRFTVGQPLGAYSSWAMLALTHHILCRMAIKLSGTRYDPENPTYAVVGDDNCLIGSKLESYYQYLLKEVCHLGISPLKGFSNKTLSGSNPLSPYESHSVAEFCKRVFYNGNEISTVSPVTLKEATEYPVSFPMLISDNNKRNLELSVNGLASLAWMGYNPDQALLLCTFPFTSALPSSILVELEPMAEDLGLPWYTDEFKSLSSQVYTGTLLESVKDAVSKFSSQIVTFKDYLTGKFTTSRYIVQAPNFYRPLLGLIADQFSYGVVKLVEKIKPGKVVLADLKRLVDGLIDMDDLSELFMGKSQHTPIDQPKRVSRRLQAIVGRVSKAFRGELKTTLDLYSYFEQDSSSISSKPESDLSDVVFIDAEDDWTFVVPIEGPGDELDEWAI